MAGSRRELIQMTEEEVRHFIEEQKAFKCLVSELMVGLI